MNGLRRSWQRTQIGSAGAVQSPFEHLVRPQVEKAGGHSSADGQCISSLDVPIKEYDQRTQVEPYAPPRVTPPNV